MTKKNIQPITGPSVWTASDFAERTDWIHRLSEDALADIDRAMVAVKREGKALDDIGPEDFDLPALREDLGEMKDILGHGRGFVLIKGIDRDRYTDDELGIITWGLGTHIGLGVSQSFRGDRLGYVIDRGETNRYYTRGGEIEFHMDPVDVVGLLCVREAVSGGESWVVSSMKIHNVLLEERPDLLQILYDGFHYSTKSTAPAQGTWGSVTPHRLPVFAHAGKNLTCFYLPNPLREGTFLKDGDDAGRLLEAVDYFAEVASRPELSIKMDIRPGDIQFLNNRLVLHHRTDYRDHEAAEQKRLLYRLWLMMPDWAPRPDSMQMREDADRGGGGIPQSDTPPPLLQRDDRLDRQSN